MGLACFKQKILLCVTMVSRVKELFHTDTHRTIWHAFTYTDHSTVKGLQVR